jgi:3-hydroxy acid dehydrogenase / malonic semialdehyde reductase
MIVQDKLEALTSKLASSHPNQKFIYRSVDVGDHEAVDKEVASAIDEIGQVDILINNASLVNCRIVADA